MKAIENIINIQLDQQRCTTMFAILGKYGDLLPPIVQEELRKDAETLQKSINKRVETFKL